MKKNVNQQLVETLLRRIERLEEENEDLRRQLVALLSRTGQEFPGPWVPEIPKLPPVKKPFYYGAGDSPSGSVSKNGKDRFPGLEVRL